MFPFCKKIFIFINKCSYHFVTDRINLHNTLPANLTTKNPSIKP